MKQKQKDASPPFDTNDNVEILSLHVRADLYRAFRRCSWILINETGKNQVDIMNEMVQDFLIKHGC